jgi:hypothetical protein
LAHVLVGDLHKEIALAHNQSLDRARSSYAAAHPLYLALHAEALKARQPQDDLAHNFMRLAALDIFENKLDAAEDQLQEARKLIENLTADYSDSPYTFGLLRELAGLSGSLAERRGNHPAAMAMMDKMLESIQVVHRMDPDNLFYTSICSRRPTPAPQPPLKAHNLRKRGFCCDRRILSCKPWRPAPPTICTPPNSA